MATYNPIGNTEIDPESPITSSLFTRLRDNPLAMFEGATGAPRLLTNGIEDNAVTAAKMNPNTAAISGDTNSGSVLINDRLRINWIRFSNVTSLPQSANWVVPFSTAVYAAVASNNFTGETFKGGPNISINAHTLTDVTVQTTTIEGGIFGWVIAIGT